MMIATLTGCKTTKNYSGSQLLLKSNDEITNSGNIVLIDLLWYSWDGWGISTKTVGACGVVYNIIDALKKLISAADQEINLKLHCQQSDDNLAAGDFKTVQLKKAFPRLWN